MSYHADLAAISSGLDQLSQRITALAEESASHEDEMLSVDLFEVERTLNSAQRRLRRTILALERRG